MVLASPFTMNSKKYEKRHLIVSMPLSVALNFVAMEYILTERLENVQDLPLLSTNDIRLLIAKEIRSRDDYASDDKRFEQLEKRHLQQTSTRY